MPDALGGIMRGSEYPEAVKRAPSASGFPVTHSRGRKLSSGTVFGQERVKKACRFLRFCQASSEGLWPGLAGHGFA